MRITITALAVEILWMALALEPAWADGGMVRLVERHGDRQISVFTAPNPLRAGPVDVSVLVQDASTGQPLADLDTSVTITPASGVGVPIMAAATTEAATNKLLQSAMIELPGPGAWDVHVRSTSVSGPIDVRFTMTAGRALPRWLSQWTWFSWPAIVVLLFAAHRSLVARRRPSRFAAPA